MLLALLYDSQLLHFNNNHIIDKSHDSYTSYVLVLGVWSPLRQTRMGNSPQQFEALETSGYPWVNITVEGELHGSTCRLP